jgi:hypothetical protein
MSILFCILIHVTWSVVAFVPSYHHHHSNIHSIRRRVLMPSFQNKFNDENNPCNSFHFLSKQNKDHEEDNGDYNDDDDDDDDDEYIDENSLGNWRSFRATLVGSSSIISSSPEDGLLLDKDDQSEVDTTTSKVSSKETINSTRSNSVSKENEDLLRSQSDILAEEYKGIWCHELSLPEVGGLVIRLPLEAELYKNKDKLSILGKELIQSLQEDDDEDRNINIPTKDTNPSDTESNRDDTSDDSTINDSSFSRLTAQTIYWYRKVQRMIQDKMKRIASLADGNGTIDPRQLAPQDETLLNLYVDNQSTWQEVCLVIKRDEEGGIAQTLALNRPMAFSLSENLAKLVLFGSYGGMVMGSTPVSQTNRYLKFLRAFESSCGVYVGGPDNMSEPAILIHGFSELEGSKEISPGTGIYQGGLDAAIEGVLSGKYKPLEFRFFVGRHDYKNGDLDVKIYSNKYHAVACTRALALKQCIQLPKPLWHEVMELCGGELSEISKLEFQKRTDLQ